MTDVGRERIPLFWSRGRERMLAKGFSFNMGDVKNKVVWKVREVGWG